MGHAGAWSSGDARGWKSSRGGQAVASPAPPEAETSAATWPPDLCSSLLVTRPRVKPAGVGSTSRGRRRRAARGSHAGVLPGRLGVRGDLSAHSRRARSPWTRCGGRAGGGSGRLVPHPRLAQLPGVWAAAHCSRCPHHTCPTGACSFACSGRRVGLGCRALAAGGFPPPESALSPRSSRRRAEGPRRESTRVRRPAVAGDARLTNAVATRGRASRPALRLAAGAQSHSHAPVCRRGA